MPVPSCTSALPVPCILPGMVRVCPAVANQLGKSADIPSTAGTEVELVSSSAAEAPAPAQPSEAAPAAGAPAQGAAASPAAPADDEPPPPEPFGKPSVLRALHQSPWT